MLEYSIQKSRFSLHLIEPHQIYLPTLHPVQKVSFKGNKDKPVAKCIWIDMSSKAGVEKFWEYIATGRVKYVHFAPPCGTASARTGVGRRDEAPQTGPYPPRRLCVFKGAGALEW